MSSNKVDARHSASPQIEQSPREVTLIATEIEDRLPLDLVAPELQRGPLAGRVGIPSRLAVE